MKFADPLFLLALGLVLIPILIHFLQFKRYKLVYFSQVNFLKLLINESKKKNNLKQLLILLCRILSVVFLVLAFARPYWPLRSNSHLSNQYIVGIYLDNSFSMNGKSENGTLLDEARHKALELANSFPRGTNFIFITNDLKPEKQAGLSKEQLINEISRTVISPSALQMSQVLAVLDRQMSALFPKASKSAYLFSDFQSYQCDFDKWQDHNQMTINILSFKSLQSSNICIDSVWFEHPGHLGLQTEVAKVRLRNLSDHDYQTIPLRLLINDSLKAIQPISLKAGETLETELSYSNYAEGTHRGVVEIDDYPIVFDNSFFFSYRVEKEVRALAIYQSGDQAFNWLEKLFANDAQVRFNGMDARRLQLNQLELYQCIYLLNLNEISGAMQDALNQFSQNGGSLIVFPAAEANKVSYNQLFERLRGARLADAVASRRKMDYLNLNHPLFRDVFNRTNPQLDLPFVQQSFRFEKPAQNQISDLIRNNDASVALCEVPAGKGRLYQFCFPLSTEAGNFYHHALFVPVVYNLALHSYFPQTIQHTIQNNQLIQLKIQSGAINPSGLSLRNQLAGNSFRLPPSAWGTNQLRFMADGLVYQAGFCELYSDENLIGTLAFNYNRNESENSFLTPEQFQQLASDTQQQVPVYQTNQANWMAPLENTRDLIELWKYCLLLALAFIVSELLIIRFWK